MWSNLLERPIKTDWMRARKVNHLFHFLRTYVQTDRQTDSHSVHVSDWPSQVPADFVSICRTYEQFRPSASCLSLGFNRFATSQPLLSDAKA